MDAGRRQGVAERLVQHFDLLKANLAQEIELKGQRAGRVLTLDVCKDLIAIAFVAQLRMTYLMCEGRDGIYLLDPEYERVRADSRRSVVATGHDNPAIERVVEETDRFVVTEKFGVAAEVYGELDPRS